MLDPGIANDEEELSMLTPMQNEGSPLLKCLDYMAEACS
jgi:hypothetical protein